MKILLAAVVLTVATHTAAVSYGGDYSGAKMPEYGSPADYEEKRETLRPPEHDYRDRPRDYNNYDEDPRGRPDKLRTKRIRNKDVDFESRRETEIKKNDRKWPVDDANVETLDKYSPPEMVSKFATSNKFLPRSKPRPRYSETEGEISHKRDSKLLRNAETGDEGRYNNYLTEHEQLHRHKDTHFEDKEPNFDYKATTTRQKKPRRMPRDRGMPPPELDGMLPDMSDEYKIDDPLRSGPELSNKEDDSELEYPEQKISKRPPDYVTYNAYRPQKPPAEVRKTITRTSPRRKEFHTEEHFESTTNTPKTMPGNEIYDSNYYDMKRLSKLPTLRRRPSTTKEEELVVPRHRAKWFQTTRSWVPGPMRDTYIPPKLNYRTPYRRVGGEDIEPVVELTDITFPATRTTLTTTTTTTDTTTQPTTTSTSTLLTTTMLPQRYGLSFKEKSRLSILKKAMRKEHLANSTTQKPPVLFQLVTKMATIVMVEPTKSAVPNIKALAMSDDTPEKLQRVKRLMRKKLVDSAKNINELTQNWNDLVCDYVDTALIESTGFVHYSNLWFTVLCLCTIIVCRR